MPKWSIIATYKTYVSVGLSAGGVRGSRSGESCSSTSEPAPLSTNGLSGESISEGLNRLDLAFSLLSGVTGGEAVDGVSTCGDSATEVKTGVSETFDVTVLVTRRDGGGDTGADPRLVAACFLRDKIGMGDDKGLSSALSLALEEASVDKVFERSAPIQNSSSSSTSGMALILRFL